MEIEVAKSNLKIHVSRLTQLLGCGWGKNIIQAQANAQNIIKDELQRFQPAAFKVGICASPLQRFTHPAIGYEQHGYEMTLLAASDSSVIVKLEKHVTDAYIGSEGCQNIARSGGGRCPSGYGSFLYVVAKR